MQAIQRPLTALAAAALLAVAPAMAKTFKWSSASDIPTWDIHSQNNALGNGVHAAVYESLFYYNSKTFALEPQLATGYKQVSPTQVRITLRPGVKFHDGASFNADDAKFSLDRAMAKTSNYGPYIQGIDRIVKVDDMTIDVFTKGPNPVLLRQLTELRMMDKEWSEKNKSVEPKDIKTKDENFAHRNANGTGPFVLKSWEQDVKLVLAKNPNWWGKMDGNVTEIVYTPIKSEATRVAALLSGEVDMVLDPSPADLARLRGGAQTCAPRPTSRWSTAPRTARSSSAWTSSATSCRAATSKARTR
jgi:peptide/nickel transport system substrate-binding protein